MATSIATRALPPRGAVALSAVLNVAGAFISLKVATTISKGIVNSSQITLEVLLAALIGAIVWNLITWYFSLPSGNNAANRFERRQMGALFPWPCPNTFSIITRRASASG